VVPNVPFGSQPLVAIDEQHQSVRATGTFSVKAGFALTPAGAAAGSATSPGVTVTAVGHGFTANSTVSGFKFDSTVLPTTPASVSTDGSGNFTSPITFTVPAATAGNHTVTATDASAKVGSQTLMLFAPKVSISPVSASPTTGVTVSGTGFPAGDSIFVQIGSTTFDQDVVCSIAAAPDGSIAGNQATNTCTVPNVVFGAQPLVGIDEQQEGVRAISTFAVKAGFVLTPTGASAGAATSPGVTVSVVGHGFATSSTVSGFKFDGAALATSPASVSTDGSGNFTGPVTFTVPATTAATHTVTATDASANTGSQTVTLLTPKVSVTPKSAVPGTGLTVSGSGWTPGDSIFIQIGSTTFDHNVVCSIAARPDGTFSGNQATNSCVVPNAVFGAQPLFAIDEQQEGVQVTGAFTIKAGFVLTPTGGSAGAATSPGVTVAMVGHGFTASSTVSGFKFDGAALATSPASVSTDASGNFTTPVTFTVPAAAAGKHTVSATDASAKVGKGSVLLFTPSISVSPTSGAPSAGLTVSGAGFPAGDSIFVQIGSTNFDQDVVCAIIAAPDGTIAGNQASNSCTVPSVPTGSHPLVAIDEQQEGVRAFGTNFTVT
jgi:hypothetical protein